MTDKFVIPLLDTSKAKISDSCLLYCGHTDDEHLPPFERKYILEDDIVEIIKKAIKR